jgi:hypothetical protein
VLYSWSKEGVLYICRHKIIKIFQRLCSKLVNPWHFLSYVDMHCNRWGRFDALDIRLYIGPHADIRVLQCVTVNGGN